jgi:hypothetical protein
VKVDPVMWLFGVLTRRTVTARRTKNRLLEPTSKVSRAKLGAPLQELGDIPAEFEIERLILPGVTQLTD